MGKLEFEHQQKRDDYVRNYCISNNIKLLELHYQISFDMLEDYLNEQFDNIDKGIIAAIPMDFFYELLKVYRQSN